MRAISILLLLTLITPAFSLDAVIVLGHALTDNGTQLSQQWIERLNLGIDLANNYSSSLVLSGMFSEFAYNYSVTRTNASIIIENASLDTVGNAVYTKLIAISNNWTNLMIVTSDYHLSRSRNDFKFVYGKDYNLLFSGSKSSINNFDRLTSVVIEDFKIIFKKILFLGVPAGDHELILKRLLEFHPRYALPGFPL